MFSVEDMFLSDSVDAFGFSWISLCLQVGLFLLHLDFMKGEYEKGQASSVAPFKMREIQ